MRRKVDVMATFHHYLELHCLCDTITIHEYNEESCRGHCPAGVTHVSLDVLRTVDRQYRYLLRSRTFA